MAPRHDHFALVTGASSGIGLELARCFAKDGHPLVVVAEDRAALERAANELLQSGAPRVEIVAVNLARPGAAGEVREAVHALGIRPEFLVNNAGVGVHGDFACETNLQAELAMIQLNVIAVVELTKLFVRDMVTRGSGKILITASMAAIAPSPKLTVYSATKAFDYAFAEGLANELKDTGVSVTALLPDATETEFFERAGMADTELAQSKKASPAEIAAAGYSAMMKGADHVIAPFTARLRAALTAILPERMVTEQARAD